MRTSRLIVLMICTLVPTALFAQTSQQPGAATVVVTRPKPPGVDLSIASVEWLPPQPLRDESQFLNATKTLASGPARLIALGPKLFISAVTETVGPKQNSSVASGIVVSPIFRVKIRNAGKERWASTGSVSVNVFQGRPEDVSKPADFRLLIEESKMLVPISRSALGRSAWANSAKYMVGIGQVPGSVGPDGQTADVQIAFLNGIAHPDDRLARYRYRMLVDKYYTARVNLTAEGDDTPRNNGVDFVFRLDANGLVVEGRMMQRDTSTTIRVEGGGGVTITPKKP